MKEAKAEFIMKNFEFIISPANYSRPVTNHKLIAG